MKPYCLWWVDRPISDEQVDWQLSQMVRQGVERVALGGVTDDIEWGRLSAFIMNQGIEMVMMESGVDFFEPWARAQSLAEARVAYIGASSANIPQQPIALLRAFLDESHPESPGLFYQSPQWPFFNELLKAFNNDEGPIHVIPPRSGRVVDVKVEDWHFIPHGGNFLRMEWEEAEEGETVFVVDEPVAGLRVLALTREKVAGLTLDGIPLEEAGGWEVDMGMRTFAVAGDLALGEHSLGVVRNTGWVWLAGDFQVQEVDGIPHLRPIRGVVEAAWEENGFGDFSGSGTYINSICIPAFGEDEVVEVDVLMEEGVLEVEVNGEVVGNRCWAPYRVDISSYVKPGKEVMLALHCTNSLANMWGLGAPRISGMTEGVCFRVGPPLKT